MNKVHLSGRLTAKPELKYTQSNTPVLAFTLAVNRPKQKDKEQETDFINIVAWRNTAEFISKYFDKGQAMLLSGKIQVRNYEDKEGKKRTITEVIADEVEFMGSKKQEEDPYAAFGEKVEYDNQLPF